MPQPRAFESAEAWTPESVFAGAYAGVDYLLIRPHFSQAIAFAEGTQTPTSYRVEGRELEFSYDSSLRAYFGVSLGDNCGTAQFTYWRLQGEVNESGNAAPGRFLVDPFGGLAGRVTVVDPQSALFGATLVGGDRIETRASVDLNLYDLDYVRPLLPCDSPWDLRWSAGARIADVEQFYGSTLLVGGLAAAHGDYRTEFIGAGPRLGVQGRRNFGDYGFSLFANGHGSLLLGNYESEFGNLVLLPAPFEASQSESLTRLVPVVEAELGGAWQITQCLSVSAGWLFQAWFDQGTSGGKFNGLFTGTDDSNIMSFDGLFLRSEYAF